MTITHQTNFVTYTGNGSATNFPFAFRVDDEDHMIVTRITIADGTRVVISSNDYTVNGIGDPAGGSVDYSPALSSSYQLELKRIVPLTQDLDIQNQGGFFPEVVEAQLDLLEMQIQQTDTFIREVEEELTEEIARVEEELGDEIDAVETGLTNEIAARIAGDNAEASARIAGDQALAAAILAGGGGGGGGGSVYVFESRAAAEASVIESLATFVWVAGYLLPGDHGKALYKKVVSEPLHEGKFQSVDGAWWELAETILRIEMFGGGIDKTGAVNHAAILDAINMIDANPFAFGIAAGGVIEFGYGTYQISDTIHLKRTVTFRGMCGSNSADNPRATVLKFPADKHGIIIHNIDSYGETSSFGAWVSGTTYTAGTSRHVAGTIGPPRVIGRVYSLTTAGPGVTANRPEHYSGSVTGADGYEWKFEALYSAGGLSSFESIAIEGGYSSGGTVGHGIWARNRFYANNVHISFFPENGYHIQGWASINGLVKGNVNNWRIYGGRVIGCKNGLFTQGNDVNAGTATGVDCSSNRGWGFWDDAFLGNAYFGCHTNGNASGARRQYDGIGYVCVDLTAGLTTIPPADEDVWWFAGNFGEHATDGDWLTGTTYAVNDIVKGLGPGDGHYKCTISPGTPSTDQPVHAAGTVGYADGYTWKATIIGWISGTTYVTGGPGVGSVVIAPTNHATYRATVAGAGASTDEPSHATGTVAYPDGWSWVQVDPDYLPWVNGDTTLTEGGCFKMNDGANVLFGCYAEGGQPAHVVGSTLGIFPGFDESNLTKNSGGQIWNGTINELYVRKRAADGNALDYNIMPGRDNNVLVNIEHPEFTATGRNMELDDSNGTIFVRDFNSNTTRTEVDTLHNTTVTFGRSNKVAHAKYIDRLFLHTTSTGGGSLTAARQVTTGTQIPTAGEWGVGDFIINSAPAAGEPIGWRCIVAGTPGTWQPIQDIASHQSLSSGAAFTLTPGTSPHRTLYSGTMTADRAVTLTTTGAFAGLTYHILRTATGAFNLNVGTGPLVALSAIKQWCDVTFDGSAYYLSGYGTLP